MRISTATEGGDKEEGCVVGKKLVETPWGKLGEHDNLRRLYEDRFEYYQSRFEVPLWGLWKPSWIYLGPTLTSEERAQIRAELMHGEL